MNHLLGKMKIKRYITFFIVMVSLWACKKEEGYGGLASISGNVYAYDYNNAGLLVSEGYAGDIDVYIRAKGSSQEIDRIRTSYDGSFIFKQLRKGQYEVWVYTDCNACPNGIDAVIKSVEIDKKKTHAELETFEVNI